MKVHVLISLWLAGLFLAACQPVRDELTPMPPEAESSQLLTTPEPGSPLADKMDDSMTNQPEHIPPIEPIPPVTGEAPSELMEAILQDLAQRAGAVPGQVTVNRAQAVVWNDGSLGCPQPGMVYTQALVRGYWVVLTWDGKTYDYHAATNGYFILCESGLPPLGTPGLPDK